MDKRTQGFYDYIIKRDPRAAAGTIQTGDGFGVPSAPASRILENLNARSIMRRFGAQVRTIPTESGTVSGGIGSAAKIAEGDSYAEAADQTDVNVSLVKYGGRFSLSEEATSDNVLDLWREFAIAAGVALARIENAEFMTGTGSGEPQGIFSLAATQTTAATGAITFAEILDLDESLAAEWDDPAGFDPGSPEAYLGPVYAMHPSTAVVVRTLDAGTDDLDRQGRLRTLFGRPVFLDSNIPEIAAGASVIAVFNPRGYVIAQRREVPLSLRVGVDHDTHASTWDFAERIDGRVWDTDAVAILKMADS